MKNKNEKDHILWNPNKNYLGSWDIPKNGDLILTIKGIDWKEVENPTNGQKTSERVIEFEEEVKPMICNETNARSINIATKKDFRSEMGGERIAIYAESGKWFGEERKALRIRQFQPQEKIKMVLTPEHEKFQGVVDKMVKEDLEPEFFEEWFDISDEIKLTLNNIKNETI